ncbi:tannase/feruloyl esterase family alpha/beta hydrolase [Novosphingobium terrae]|uniref:tannase/feruloyl esterase family alpha/beta hydrolase n=1 Tax=Novosphingobium terrae TaxID=2726189 RepID=UPI001980CF7D|nr:tannase/feruloyl esterase family alpha/beta hydrolase [Novosphingobium terrae]
MMRGAGVAGVAMAVGLAGLPGQAQAATADRLDLAPVKPVVSCESLSALRFDGVTDAPTTVTASRVEQTEKGAYCKVEGTVAPTIAFTVELPMERWTQRFLENAMGRQTPAWSSGCAPATDGEFVVASDHSTGAGGGQTDVAWTSQMQKRIDYAYRGNHQTALVAKALIRAFYGQAPKFSYFMGCSEGGRQALMEAQRFPDDFDGVTAGAPVAIDSVHNVFFHPWEDHVNHRADGSRILVKDRLALLHAAVVRHCGTAAGLIDGMLQQPTACRFDASWVQCAPGKESSTCLTPEEVAVVERLYRGPSGDTGRKLEIGGWPLGSEGFWKLSTATEYGDRETKEGFAMRRLFLPPDGEKSAGQLEAEFRYDQSFYDKTMALASLYNAANTDLAPFEKRGGRLILWHGAEDLIVQPEISLAYYQGVQKLLGAARTDTFLRYFLLPGVGHCTGGEGPNQIDLLTPLMAWTELHRAPTSLTAGKVQDEPGGMGRGPTPPYAAPAKPTSYTRPIYPFPQVARYSGQGDAKDAASYVSVRGPIKLPQTYDTQAERLIGPDNQRDWNVVDGKLVDSAR